MSRLRGRLFDLSFALGVGALLLGFVGGLAYLVTLDGRLPLRTDPLLGAHQRDSKGDVAGALNQYRIAALIDSNDLRALNEMGELLVRSGRYQGALEAFDKVLEVKPDGRALAGSGDALLGQHRYAEAADAYERSLLVVPNRASVLNGLGMARSMKGDLDGAIAAFEASVALEPRSTAGANLARVRAERYRTQGR